MNHHLQSSLSELTEIQQQAVTWNKGSLLVLAGPGSGKTRVLTCRIARLLEESRSQRFRILALTFTNKAADEMSDRIHSFVPELIDRVSISTFHGFCVKVLRQHGVHIGINPNFRIYSQVEDRKVLLQNALRRDPEITNFETHQILPLIDRLKTRLLCPENAELHHGISGGTFRDAPELLIKAYRLYEEELQQANALDFHSLIFEAYKLFKHPALVKHYQTVYKYWLIDEFQDTNEAQYRLLRRMVADDFEEIFAVADDDQTIYEWNGANVGRISTMVSDFSCKIIQLPTNFRCPPPIVEAANRLLVYNIRRLQNKNPSESSQHEKSERDRAIQYRVFLTHHEEATSIADEIDNMSDVERSHTLILARNRSLLQSIHDHLEAKGISSIMLVHRGDFVSPQMRYLIACLRQIDRPLDLHNLASLINISKNIDPIAPDIEDIISRSQSESTSYLSDWIDAVKSTDLSSWIAEAVNILSYFTDGSLKLDQMIGEMTKLFAHETDDLDLQEDLRIWHKISSTFDVLSNRASLGQCLQELDLRSKASISKPGSVSLATIHGAKGLEFDAVYLIGLAEEILPSWYSIQENNGGPALEEERRACFVAITRAKKRLVLSHAKRYNGSEKHPSRFLREMGMLERKSLQNKILNPQE